jgi:DNA-binding NarL/FixJ family response regulator
MKKSNYTRTIYFLCEDKNATYPFIEQLERQIRLTIPKIEPDDLMLALQQNKHKILMFAHDSYTTLKSQIRSLPLANRSFETIVFNVERRLTTDELLAFGHLKGLFYYDASLEALAKGCCAIINGENWLPRKVSSQLLYHYRNVIELQSTPAVVDLTQRELQLLRCLMLGASNNDIADDLFISEFTVKSHLQKIFKKLSVKNRVQAAAWGKQHLNPML